MKNKWQPEDKKIPPPQIHLYSWYKCTGDLDLGYDVNGYDVNDDAKEENYQFQAHCVAVTEEEHSLYKTISSTTYFWQN